MYWNLEFTLYSLLTSLLPLFIGRSVSPAVPCPCPRLPFHRERPRTSFESRRPHLFRFTTPTPDRNRPSAPGRHAPVTTCCDPLLLVPTRSRPGTPLKGCAVVSVTRDSCEDNPPVVIIELSVYIFNPVSLQLIERVPVCRTATGSTLSLGPLPEVVGRG